MPTSPHQVLIAGQWRDADVSSTFRATDPNRNQALANEFPVSSWPDCEAALDASAAAARELNQLPRNTIAACLDLYAELVQGHADELVKAAFAETGLAKRPRLAEVELPRTTNQLRLAAEACRTCSWALPTIDTKAEIRSCFEPIGPVAVFGPNNFPFAFGSVSGGDFAAAIAAGNPVIGKANSSHPETTRQLALLAHQAVQQTGLPAATVQLIYRTSHADGERLVADPRLGATGYTGSRAAGLKLKQAADRVGKPIYLELSSINPVVITPAALAERGDQIVEEFVSSVLMGSGQFCTNPGLVLLIDDAYSTAFVHSVAERFRSTEPGTLLSPAVQNNLATSIDALVQSGASRVTGDGNVPSDRCAHPNTLLQASGQSFLKQAEELQREAFGNAALMVVAKDCDELVEILRHLEGNLTGCLYTATAGSDEQLYAEITAELTPRVGRLLNDKMPTGVAVSPAMNHGGPYPATGHPGFTAVGIPASLRRFAKLTCYDHVRSDRLPELLRDKNPSGQTWRLVDGEWTVADL